MDLATVLSSAQSPDIDVRSQSEAYLNHAVETQYGPFLLALVFELATEGKPVSNRQLAGIFMKNLISAQDDDILEEKQAKWLMCENVDNIKDNIRAGFLQAIKSPLHIVSHTAAQVLAAYGAVDVPRNMWPDLLPSLFFNINSPDIHEGCKISSLEALGFMCELIDPDTVEPATVNQILTSIVDGMRTDRSNNIRQAAVAALRNSINFTSSNFENQIERDALMQCICEAAKTEDVRIRSVAFECIATIGELYYEQLQGYFETLFNVTMMAIKTDEAIVALQAIEFWFMISDQEIDILEDVAEGMDVTYLKVIETSSATLVPLLLESMAKQEEEEDEDEEDTGCWTLSMAAASCLESVAIIVKDQVMDYVLPFVQLHFNSPNWNNRDAALQAFGCVIGGTSADRMAPIVVGATLLLLGSLKDASSAVRDTTAWVFGRIFQDGALFSRIPIDQLSTLVNALLESLGDPRETVIKQACFSIESFATACGDERNEQQSRTDALFIEGPLLQRLFGIIDRPTLLDKTRLAAFDAITALLSNCPEETSQIQSLLTQVMAEVLRRLESSFDPMAFESSQDRFNRQASLSGLVGEMVKKMSLSSVLEIADRLMNLLLQVCRPRGSLSTAAVEDAMVSIGCVVEKLGEHFDRFLSFLQPLLLGALSSVDEETLLTIAAGVMGDLCRARGRELPAALCDEVMATLFQLLQSPSLHRTVQPTIISLFSDIAMALEVDFERYLAVVLSTLHEASKTTVHSDDEDTVAFIDTLRGSILEAYTGILMSFDTTPEKKQQMLLQSMDSLMNLFMACSEKTETSDSSYNRSDSVLRAMVGLLGDLGSSFGKQMRGLYSQPFVSELLLEAQSNIEDEEGKETVDWTLQMVQSIMND